MRAQQAAGGAPPADNLKFSSESALIIFQIKPDKTADFEAAWAAIKAKLAASDKADFKELGDSFKILKVAVPAGAGAPANAIYVFQIASASKTLSYNPVAILYAPGMWERKDADELYKKINDSLDSLSALPLAKVGG